MVGDFLSTDMMLVDQKSIRNVVKKKNKNKSVYYVFSIASVLHCYP